MNISFTMLLKGALFLCLAFACVNTSADEPVPASLRALLITGQSNHNWPISAPVLKMVLEDTGIFLVDVAQTPPAGGDMSGFMPQFAAYDVIVLNYTGDAWPETTNKAFVEYVSNGGGVVVVHEANNAFPEWPEYNEITGLGGWGNRNERHGPYVVWRDDRVIYDTTPGPGGAHGRQHKFEIIHRQPEHPITRGLPERWLHNTDELYHQLRGPARNMTILGTAWSDPETGGTGEHEPILFTITYGEGRIFQTALGHAGPAPATSPALQCAGFIITLQRGAEWAATGNVTQPVPDDFPGKDTVRIRPRFTCNSAAVLMSELASYTYNDSLETPVLLEELTRKRTGAKDAVDDLERGYMGLLQSSDATKDAKIFACKQLSIVGGNTAVPVLAGLLLDKDLSHMARYALERIPGGMSLRALRNALPQANPELRAGIITSLGVRQDFPSVTAISMALQDNNDEVAAAALRALAEFGDPKAASALRAAIDGKSGDLKKLAETSYIKCGYNLMNSRRPNDAREVFDGVYALAKDNPTLRTAALHGRIAVAGKTRACDVIIETLRSDDREMHPVVAAAARNVTHPHALRALAAVLSELDEYPKALLLTALMETPAQGVAEYIMDAARSDSEMVRIAALQALAVLGDAKATLFLAERAASSSEAEQSAARHSLSRLKGASPVIVKALEEGDPALRPELLRAIASRRITSATPLLINRLPDANPEEKVQILQVLTEIAGPEHLEMLLPLLLASENRSEGIEMADMVATVAERAETGEARIASLKSALETETKPSARHNLYAALGKMADAEAISLLEAGLEEPDATVRLAAVNALAAWPTDAPLALLRSALERFKGTPEGAVALGGYIRQVGLNEQRSADETAAMYIAVLPFAESTLDKQSCIAAIGKTGAVAALPVLYETLASDDMEVSRAAARALGGWPDAAPMAKLESLAKDGPEALRPEALRGYFRLIGINHAITEEEALERYRQALALAPSDAERKRIMAGLASAETPGALRVVIDYLDHPELKSEAEVAAVKIAAQVAGSHPGSVKNALEKVEASTENDFVRGEIKKVYEQIARFEDYLTAWEIAGPYTLDSGGLDAIFNEAFAPEHGETDHAVEWRLIAVGTNAAMPYLIEMDKALGGDNRAAYLRTNLWSDIARDALLEIGSDDGNKVWLNGELVHENNAVRPVTPGQDVVKIKLLEGWNPLLIKVTQGSGEWSACVRIRTADGGVLKGLRASVRTE